MIFKNSKDPILVYNIGLITVLKKIEKKSDHEMTGSLALQHMLFEIFEITKIDNSFDFDFFSPQRTETDSSLILKYF